MPLLEVGWRYTEMLKLPAECGRQGNYGFGKLMVLVVAQVGIVE